MGAINQFRRGFRLSVAAGVVALVALAIGGGAAQSATIYPVFNVGGNGNLLAQPADTYFDLFDLEGAIAPNKVVITTPAGYSLTVQHPVQSTIGDAGLYTLPASGKGAPTAWTGKVTVLSATDFAADPQTATCAPGTHTAMWALAFKKGTTTLTFPVAIDAAGTKYKFTVCLGALDPTTTRASEVYFDMAGVVKTPRKAGRYVFSAAVTGAAAGVADPTTTYEMRADEELPQLLGAVGSYDPSAKELTVTGTLTARGKPRAGINVHVYGTDDKDSFDKDLGSTVTDKNGSYIFTKKTTKPPPDVFGFVNHYIGASCFPSATKAPGGCVSESLDGLSSGIGTVTNVETFTFKAVPDAAHTKTIDKPPTGTSKGDVIHFQNALENAVAQLGKKKGASVGTEKGTKTYTSARAFQITGVATLPGGTVRYATFTFKSRAVIIINGGTGKFKHALGTVTIGGGAHPVETFRITTP